MVPVHILFQKYWKQFYSLGEPKNGIKNKRNSKNNFMINLACFLKVDKINSTHETKSEKEQEIILIEKCHNPRSTRKDDYRNKKLK